MRTKQWFKISLFLIAGYFLILCILIPDGSRMGVPFTSGTFMIALACRVIGTLLDRKSAAKVAHSTDEMERLQGGGDPDTK